MTKAEEIFEKHIGLNSELGYLPIKKEDVIDAINEALGTKTINGKNEMGFDVDTETYEKNKRGM